MAKATLEVEGKPQTKSELIRQFVAENPQAGPTEISRMIQEKHGVKVSAGMVSTTKSLDKNRGGKPANRGRPLNKAVTRQENSTNGNVASNVDVTMLVKVKKLARLRVPHLQ